MLDRHADGRPHHVKATLKIMGITDKEVLEYHWGDRWMVWDSAETFQQRGQHGEYNLTPEGDGQRGCASTSSWNWPRRSPGS